MYVHRRTLVAVADRFLGVDCSLITSLGSRDGSCAWRRKSSDFCCSFKKEKSLNQRLSFSDFFQKLFFSSEICFYIGSTCFWASRIRIHQSEVWIRILLSASKNSKKLFCDFFGDFLSLKNDVNVPSKSKKLFFKLVFCCHHEGQ
jgi:hypothetical protein